MTCKQDHNAPDAIPAFLCRACHPELSADRPTRHVDAPRADRVIVMSGMHDSYAKAKLRKLRAEEKRLSELIDDIGPRDQAKRRKLYDLIRVVEQDIDKVRSAIAA